MKANELNNGAIEKRFNEVYRDLEALVRANKLLDQQLINLSALCVRQHAELKVLRSYFDPQYDAIGALGLSVLVFARACRNLVVDGFGIFFGKPRQPQAVRLK